MKVILLMKKDMERVSTIILMVVNMMAASKMMKDMVLVLRLTTAKNAMKVIGLEAKNVVRVLTSILMALTMMVIG